MGFARLDRQSIHGFTNVQQKKRREEERGWFRNAAATYKHFSSFRRSLRRAFLCFYGDSDSKGHSIILRRALQRLRR